MPQTIRRKVARVKAKEANPMTLEAAEMGAREASLEIVMPMVEVAQGGERC